MERDMVLTYAEQAEPDGADEFGGCDDCFAHFELAGLFLLVLYMLVCYACAPWVEYFPIRSWSNWVYAMS